MKIAFFGNGPWAVNTLSALLPQYNIIFVVDRRKNDGSLEKLSSIEGIPFFDDGLTSVPRSLVATCDLLVCVSFDEIFSQDLLMMFPLGGLNFHAGKLPQYRGRNPINWAMVNCEEYLWLTVHLLDKGIDTGPVIVEKKLPLGPRSTYLIMLERAYTEAPRMILDAIELLRNASNIDVLMTTQDETQAKYRRKRLDDDQVIDWSLPSVKVKKFLQALHYPGLWATTQCGNKTIKILDGESCSGISATAPGTIISVDSDTNSFTVACGNQTALYVDEWVSLNYLPSTGDIFE